MVGGKGPIFKGLETTLKSSTNKKKKLKWKLTKEGNGNKKPLNGRNQVEW